MVIDGDTVMNPGGLRHPNEAIRHKMLDAVGDLALAGAPILGTYTGDKAGHATTRALLEALLNAPDAYEMIDCTAPQAARLPGVGLKASDLPKAA